MLKCLLVPMFQHLALKAQINRSLLVFYQVVNVTV